MILRKLALCLVVLSLAISAFAQRENTVVVINAKKITIDYGSPKLGGRDMLSQATPGMVWRLGKDKPTVLETAADIKVAGKTLTAGKYSLWAKKVDDKTWVLAFHPQVPGWGDPPLTTGYAAELPLKMETATTSAESLTISLTNLRGKAAGIKIQWGTAVLSGAFDVL